MGDFILFKNFGRCQAEPEKNLLLPGIKPNLAAQPDAFNKTLIHHEK